MIEDPIDRQAMEDFHRTMSIDFNEFHSEIEPICDFSTIKTDNNNLIDENVKDC